MDVIETLVVPLDGSAHAARALEPTRSLASHLRARVVLLTTDGKDGTGARQDHLDHHAGTLGLPDVETVVVRHRAAADAILMWADAPHVVVCMSTHGRSGQRHTMLGGVADAVTRATRRPVVLVGPDVDLRARLDGGQLFVGVDGSELSEASLPTARDWARMLDLEPVIVQIIPAGGPVAVGSRAAESAYVREVARRFRVGRPPSWKVLHALDEAEGLIGDARRSRAALIALTTNGRSGASQVALGSVVSRVVRESRAPVIVTPVRKGEA